MTELSAFLHLYFYEIEDLINNNPASLQNINYQYEEANSDKELKIVLKKILLQHNSILHYNSLNVKIKDLKGEVYSFTASQISKFKITKVFLPTELTTSQKTTIKESKSGVYTNPDLYLEIENITTNEIHNITVELKSTKDDRIPGSSIQQVRPDEWVMFVQRKDGQNTIATGQYINTLTGHLPFPDRSPRPEIAYSVISKWNEENRVVDKKNNIIEFDHSKGSTNQYFLQNWHEHLSEEWLDIVVNENHKSNRWFDNTIKSYSLRLISCYDKLSQKEKKQLLERLSNDTH